MMMMMSTILEYSTRPTHPCVELGRRKKEKRVVLDLPVGTGRLAGCSRLFVYLLTFT